MEKRKSMILIADSGSTKTHWCVVEKGNPIQNFFTKGINPFFQPENEIKQEIGSALLPELQGTAFEALYFYGAGCFSEKIPIIINAVSQWLSIKTINVNSDMLAAARGLCGKNSGIACILGTGSNSCYYDGEKIVANVSPLGYILGDEGSGAVLGKLLVGDLLKNQLSPRLKDKFLAQYNLSSANIIEQVYRQPFPNRFLASFSPFLVQNIKEPAIRKLVESGFKSFLERNVMQYNYRNNPVHFTGSIAYHFREILTEVVRKSNLQLGIIRQSPMEGLIRFHGMDNE
jgi:N-acetylglucosamine kinase-like BadF-type ATPase